MMRYSICRDAAFFVLMNSKELKEFFAKIKERDKRIWRNIWEAVKGEDAEDKIANFFVVFFILIALSTCSTACRSTKSVEKAHVSIDSAYTQRQTDFRDSFQLFDRLIIRPHVITLKDTTIITNDSVRYIYRDRVSRNNRTDTVYRLSVRSDTVYAIKYKEVPREVVREKKTPFKTYVYILLAGLAVGLLAKPAWKLIKLFK